ncbi:MAG: hypothetical protein ICV84_03320 [Flavisolibacter sp.]|nr:hypothetical protein [Flavisolibacter sp.]
MEKHHHIKNEQNQPDTTNGGTGSEKTSSDTIKNAHAAGNGALGKRDELDVPVEKEDNVKNDELRREADQY